MSFVSSVEGVCLKAGARKIVIIELSLWFASLRNAFQQFACRSNSSKPCGLRSVHCRHKQSVISRRQSTDITGGCSREEAAKRIGIIEQGVAKVKLDVVQ